MSCQSCQTHNYGVFGAEVAIHFPGVRGLDIPVVWVFPKLNVCLDCGFSEFQIPEKEMQTLNESNFDWNQRRCA
jgi:hypothetical protein